MTEPDTKPEERIEDLEIYRLNENEPPTAAGGEILRPGDHVYMWCTLYQHHGIVLDTSTCKDELPPLILIAEFTNADLAGANSILQSASTASQATTLGVNGGFRIVKEDPSKWHVVKYRANPLECLTWRPGTCSAATPSNKSEILRRVQFLNECCHRIPNYHVLASNCETVAVWCVTGEWKTLQADGALKLSQIGAMALIPIGWPGWVAGGLAVYHSQHISRQWKEASETLEREWGWYSLGKPPKSNFSTQKTDDD